MKDEKDRKIIMTVFETLPPEEKETIQSLADTMRMKIKVSHPTVQVGNDSMIELLAKLGIYLNGERAHE